MTYSYCAATDVQRELRASNVFSSSTTPTLDTVNDWIEEESAYINEIAGRVFSSTQTTDTLDYDGQDYLMLENSPIISIDTFEYNTKEIGQTNYSTSWVAKTEDEDYTLYDSKGLLYLIPRNFNPSTGKKRFRIQYTYGYTTTPSVIKKLCTLLVTQRVLSTLLNQNLEERNDGSEVEVGPIRIVEPGNYGMGNFSRLNMDIDKYKNEVITKFQVFRNAW